MIQFVCDHCSAIKQPEEVWIVGQAAEAVGVVSARRAITIQSVWDRTKTLHPLAVHFCSVQCKEEYVARLFGTNNSAREVILVERSVPSEVVVEWVIPERKTVVTKTRKVHHHKRAA